ncbi:MerR family transcriptional regulator [Nocardia speluncae]|uniref:MerR family transcriptional regulator n=1 Tax=Nocardia speluncae TaxID=419477 RepID=A0A846XK93_9NOCA|nr:MerR family transcriptional regulator [Nocardia speluncae]NKY34214.1 MerR family transcriptional regulator [Nocardia speluncae]
MPESDLITIGAFARSCGITASALRFYDDSGLLAPAGVDESTGYRYYAPEQVARAVTIRRLRDIDMPLDGIGRVLAADAYDAVRLIDEHMARLVERTQQARRTAEVVKAALGESSGWPVATVRGPVLAAAVEQILAATGTDPDLPVLTGVRFETTAESLTLTATDRYRLSTRTVVPEQAGSADWAATVDGGDLSTVLQEIRRAHLVDLEAGEHSVRFRSADGGVRTCRTLPEPFPDHRALLASLPAAQTHVVVSKHELTIALERQRARYLRITVSPGSLAVSDPAAESVTELSAQVTGPPGDLVFGFTILHPAVATAIGPDVRLDIGGPRDPMVVRSADNGDLTTLAMPADPTVVDAENGSRN